MENLFAGTGTASVYLVAGVTMLLAAVIWNNFRKPKSDPRDDNEY